MTDQRRIELTVLGYRIERVQELDERGDVARQRYHVLAPGTDALLGSFARRARAACPAADAGLVSHAAVLRMMAGLLPARCPWTKS